MPLYNYRFVGCLPLEDTDWSWGRGRGRCCYIFATQGHLCGPNPTSYGLVSLSLVQLPPRLQAGSSEEFAEAAED